MILVAGGTGMLGQELVRTLLHQGRQVRVLVRPGSLAKAAPLREAGAELFGGDIRDAGCLEIACRGVEHVLCCTSAGADRRVESRRMAEYQGPINLLAAAKQNHVRQFVFTSTLFPKNPLGYKFCWAKLMAEEAIRESGVPYTILRPCGLFYEVVERGEPIVDAIGFFPIVGFGPKRTVMLAPEDMVTAFINAIDNPEAINRTFELGGPEALTFDEIVAIWSRVRGKYIRPLHLHPGLMWAIGELLRPWQPSAPGIMELLEFSYDEMSCDMRETARILGLEQMTRLEDYCRDYYARQRDAALVPAALA